MISCVDESPPRELHAMRTVPLHRVLHVSAVQDDGPEFVRIQLVGSGRRRVPPFRARWLRRVALERREDVLTIAAYLADAARRQS